MDYIIIDQLKGAVHPLVLTDQSIWTPTLFDFITLTLITYQFFLLPFACLACLCAGLCSRTLVSPLKLPYPVC